MNEQKDNTNVQMVLATMRLLLNLNAQIELHKNDTLSGVVIGDLDYKGLRFLIDYNKSMNKYELRKSVNAEESVLIHTCSENSTDATDKLLIQIYQDIHNKFYKDKLVAHTKQTISQTF